MSNHRRFWLIFAAVGLFSLMVVSIYRQSNRDHELNDVAKKATDRYNSLNATLQDTRRMVARLKRVN